MCFVLKKVIFDLFLHNVINIYFFSLQGNEI
jgi:hypothetical protein